MRKRYKTLVCIVAALFSVFTFLGFINANAKTKTVVKPKLIFVSQPKAEYKKGDKVTFQVKASNYSGKVQYRVILWNFAKKTQVELYPNMKKYGYYNVKSTPKGTSSFTVSFPVNEEGIYKISVLVKRAGAKVPYDSYVVTSSFIVDPINITEAGAVLSDGTILKAQKSNTENFYTLDLSSLKSGIGVKTYITTNKDSVLSYLNYKFNLKANEKKVFGPEDFGKVDNPPSGVNIDALREMANKDGYIIDSITLSRGSLIQRINLKIKVK
ncbi:hypothetical protein FDN13_11975 [Caloramator sp. E03]|uniref:hypothetical protein n=1 Tax=Caloramator sp. E03 TaxID=2576307 RepID=UPI0011100119|nr:hypothetical protein [Caloramator sp. E03]QCX34362.1 hypothetical protein FDN13_11975 [Caloramator sp. E03]